MRKFKLRDNVARKLRNLESAGAAQPRGKETVQPPAGPEENTPGTGTPERTGELRIAWRTDIGRVRRNNQDAVILDGGLIGVADGMGGHRGGETASCGLRDGLIRETANQAPSENALREAVQKVNLELWEQQEKDASLTGMGTTLTVLWPADGQMIVAQVGDSRAYLLREGEFRQITSDHSMVADMVRKGVLTEEQAACHPMRNYITRAVGTDTVLDVDIFLIPRRAGDRWLICSDGLHGAVRKPELARMAAGENLEEAATEMLEAALNNGGKDNISLILLQDDADVTPIVPELPDGPEQPDIPAETGEEADA